nr:hypothetical protein BaRGS_002231 [Batillaria attramentaria]
MNKGEICPETHFQCRDGYCIPTYLANNGELDCPHGEDENIPKENFTCPGFYRCYVFGNCLHSDYVCDGIYHCPNKDDERYCNLTCPANCTCEGHAYTCQEMFDPCQYLENFASFTKLGDLAKLESLSVTDIALQKFESSPFRHLEDLTTLDLSRNFIHTFEKELFKGLKKLQLLKTDNPSLCCEQIHPNDKLTQCLAPTDELSSCSDLLRSDFFRVFLWGLSLLAVTGNAGVLIYRLFLEKVGSSLAYRVLVVNLSVSDLLMGVYLAIVGAADEYFRGDYIWQEAKWKHSGVCHTAGFLAFVSGEVSALTICLITLDRFLVLRFPFSSHLHLTKVSALSACAAIWGMGVALAIVPLVRTDWQFYGQTGICLPLPILRRQFEGQSYAFGVYIVLNFVLFLLIGLGQVFIFHSIHTTAKATQKDSRQQEVTIARRLFLIIFSDFCCWFPIGLMGLLASSGTPIPGVVNVWAAIFVVPLNSALNPFLYTLNTLSERLAKKRMLRRIDKMLDSLLTELCSWPIEKVEEHVRYCITVSRMDRKLVFQCPQSERKDLVWSA